ncbi:helix-turn-helix domain-containing protein [Sphingobacterium multivorum]|uniref:helix-turn-helix domain-containing protein n=1 Tax=Sphingobacterium multivorum TaxID=28454 RepID=UPI0028A6AA2C|nr:AraC family transcriptional regulator [Sphingobacterium multivorum]
MQPLKVLDTSEHPVDWSDTLLRSARSSLRYLFPGAEVLREKLVLKKYHIELIQFNTMSPFSFRFIIDKDRLFLLFAIQGSIIFSTGGGTPIITTAENSFYPSHNGPGTYKADINDTSVVKALIISFDPKWAKTIVRSYRVLWEAIREVAVSGRQFSVLPRCRIDRAMENELAEILEFHDGNIGIVKLKFRKKIALALKHYHEMLVAAGLDIIYLAGLQILNNFTDTDLDIHALSKSSPMSEGTFLRKFRIVFGTTPYDYCVKLRMEKAQKLINEQKLSKKEVYNMVGYRDLGSFSRTYRSYYGNKGNN